MLTAISIIKLFIIKQNRYDCRVIKLLLENLKVKLFWKLVLVFSSY